MYQPLPATSLSISSYVRSRRRDNGYTYINRIYYTFVFSVSWGPTGQQTESCSCKFIDQHRRYHLEISGKWPAETQIHNQCQTEDRLHPQLPIETCVCTYPHTYMLLVGLSARRVCGLCVPGGASENLPACTSVRDAHSLNSFTHR